MFVPPRRYVRAAESAIAIYCDCVWIGTNHRLNVGIDLADVTAVAHVGALAANGNNVVGGSDVDAGAVAQTNIINPGIVVLQRSIADSGVAVALGIVKKCESPDGCVVGADGIEYERTSTNRGIGAASQVAGKGAGAGGGVAVTGSV